MPEPAAPGYHDIGGRPAGRIDRRERELLFWEKRIAAMRVLLGERGLVSLEALRNAFETFGERRYVELGFFERMLAATIRVLEERGVLAERDLEARVAALEAVHGAPRGLLPAPAAEPDPYGGSYRYWSVAGPDAPPNRHERLCDALREALVARGILDAEGIRAAIERIEAPGVHLGAKIVARAWTDAAFRAQTLDDGMAACAAFGIPFLDGRLTVLANAERTHNVVVCTLCSCYPRNLLGQPPAWYVGKAYRSRTVREPRAVLAEFGTILAPDVEVRVHDSTAELRYMVLPLRPAGTDGWDEARLATLVTRDSLIGVALARDPAEGERGKGEG
jgi:nitrile hydratase